MQPDPFFLRLTDGSWLIDNSSMEYLTTCPRSAQFYLHQRRESAAPRSALRFGGIIHEVLEYRYRHFGPSVSADERQALYSILSKAFETYVPDPEDFRNLDFAVRVIDKYLETYPVESTETYKLPNGQPAIEVPFITPLGAFTVTEPIMVSNNGEQPHPFQGELPVALIGKIDRLYTSEGGLYLQDHKTTSVLGPSYYFDFELSSQVYAYNCAVQNLTNQELSGFCLNAIAVRKPTKTGVAVDCQRKLYPLYPEHMQEWYKDFVHILHTHINSLSVHYFPKHTKHCVNKYGVCQYHTVCTLADPCARELMLASSAFKDVTWSPIAQ